MPTCRSLLSAGFALALLGHAPAEPEPPSRPELPVGEKIERLENAARQLAEAGMRDESARLRVQAAAMRREAQPHPPEPAEFQATIEALRAENRALRQRLEQIEAEARAHSAEPQRAPSLEQRAAEAHRKQTEETWARIRRAARGELEPASAAPPDQEHDLPPPRPIPLPAPDREAAPPAPDLAILRDILHTLQRIEARLKD